MNQFCKNNSDMESVVDQQGLEECEKYGDVICQSSWYEDTLANIKPDPDYIEAMSIEESAFDMIVVKPEPDLASYDIKTEPCEADIEVKLESEPSLHEEPMSYSEFEHQNNVENNTVGQLNQEVCNRGKNGSDSIMSSGSSEVQKFSVIRRYLKKKVLNSSDEGFNSSSISECHLCTKEFDSHEECKSHREAIHFLCKHCPLMFVNHDELTQHMLTGHHLCIHCSMLFADSKQLTLHLMTRHCESKCKACGEIFGRDARSLHSLYDSAHSCIQCKGCQQYFGSGWMLFSHLCNGWLQFDGEQPQKHTCHSCNMTYHTKRQLAMTSYLKSHYETCGKNLSKGHMFNYIWCSICGYSFQTEDHLALSTHLKEHYGCGICGLTYGKPAQLEDHLGYHPVCNLCSRRVENARKLNDHMRKHCHICHQLFDNPEDVAWHMKFHKSCGACGLAFNSILDKRNHTCLTKSLCCPNCDILFETQTERINHMCKGVAFPDCPHCDVPFINTFVMKAHVCRGMISNCRICTQVFKNHQDLITHDCQLNDKNLLVCKFCSEQCQNIYAFVRHRCCKLDISENTCCACGRMCGSMNNLNRHWCKPVCYKCKMCNQFYLNVYDLASHVCKRSINTSSLKVRAIQGIIKGISSRRVSKYSHGSVNIHDQVKIYKLCKYAVVKIQRFYQ